MYLPLLPTTHKKSAPETAVRPALYSTALPHGSLHTLPVMGITSKIAVPKSNADKGWMPVAYKDILVYIRRSVAM